MRQICSWQLQSTSREKWASKKLYVEFTFFVATVSHWTRNCSCIDYLTVCYLNWMYKTHRTVTSELWQNKPRWSFSFLLCRENYQTFLRTQGEVADTLYQNEQSRFPPSLKWERLWACRLKMDAPTLQRNFGWLSGRQVSSPSFLDFGSGLHFQFTWVNIISFCGIWCSWRLDSYRYFFLVILKGILDIKL